MAIQVVRPTQPDQANPSLPVSAGGPYRLSADASKIVNACRDRDNATVDLARCLESASYSSYFKLAMDRVIPK